MTALYKKATRRVLFLTTANLATNPRLTKEIRLMNGMDGISIEVVSFRLGNWGDRLEKGLEEKGVQYHYINSTRDPKKQWLQTAVAGKWYEMMSRFQSSLRVCAFAVSKRSWQLEQFLGKARLGAFDLVIAHNIGALYPAWSYTERQGGRFAFDVEDFHPGEKALDKDPIPEKNRRERLMKSLLPKAAYLSYASPLIGEAMLALVKDEQLKNRSFVLNNTFSYQEFDWTSPKTTEPRVRMIWFSQNISTGRGLEQMIPALSRYKKRVKLTIIGNLQDEMKPLLEAHADFVEWRAPLSQPELHLELQHHDVGLALEQSSEDLNKALALSNKLFAYHLAGLYVLSTDTPAQRQFLLERPYAGKVIDTLELDAIMDDLITNLTNLRRGRSLRMMQARQDAWEPESNKLVQAWQRELASVKTTVTQP